MKPSKRELSYLGVAIVLVIVVVALVTGNDVLLDAVPWDELLGGE